MKIKNLKVYDLADSIVASAYPMSTDLGDTEKRVAALRDYLRQPSFICAVKHGYLYKVETEELKQAIKDVRRAIKLCNTPIGSGHNNMLIGIRVAFDLTFTNKAWVEFQRYHFQDIISSQSTMHKITKLDIKKQCNEYVWDSTIDKLTEKCKIYNDLEDKGSEEAKELYLEILYNIPSGFQLTARVTTNYSQIRTMVEQRHNHRLPEWREFCDYMIDNLPLFKELCLKV